MNTANPQLETDIDVYEEDAEALAPGTQLLSGQYTIERYLSSGGFGITYLARDSLDRLVVIKECFPEALCSRRQNKSVAARSVSHTNEFQSLVDMFVREARSVAKLRHPNIVGVHQVFEDNHTAYMALDLIDGQDLLDKIETGSGALEPATVVSLLRTLLDAISTVHQQDMLHRDISPDNILLDRTGRPVLIDFGAAREEASKKSRAISALLVVKDGYSPQEFYISGGQQGPASDLYSLAATFYHLMTGAAPANSQSRLAALAAGKPDPYMPLAGELSGYDDAFLTAIDTAMNVFPSDRIQSAADWLARIDPQVRSKVAKADAKTAANMKRIISDLVIEVAQSIEEPGAPAVAEAPAAPEPEYQRPKRQRKLSLMEEGDEWPIEAEMRARAAEAAKPKPEPQTFDVAQSSAPYRRRIAASIAIAALAFSLFQNPDASLVAENAPQIRELIQIGKSLPDALDPWKLASL